MKTSLSVLATIATVAAVFALGCEAYSDDGDEPVNTVADTNASAPAAAQANSNSTTPSPAAAPGDGTQAAAVAPDQVDFGALRWTYGGVKGSGHSPSGVTISSLRIGGSSLSFKYNTNLSAWGYANGDIGGYACLFVQKTDGSWVGGKFDWISSSRSSRGLENVFGGYSGWNLNDVPNPCPAAFVIIDAHSKKRSNVIVGTWKR